MLVFGLDISCFTCWTPRHRSPPCTCIQLLQCPHHFTPVVPNRSVMPSLLFQHLLGTSYDGMDAANWKQRGSFACELGLTVGYEARNIHLSTSSSLSERWRHEPEHSLLEPVPTGPRLRDRQDPMEAGKIAALNTLVPMGIPKHLRQTALPGYRIHSCVTVSLIILQISLS